MGYSNDSGVDQWNLEQLRLPPEFIGQHAGKRRPPRHGPGEPFIKGPIPYGWISSACRLPGKGLHVVMAYRFYRCRFRFKIRGSRWGLTEVAGGLQVSDDTARRGLHAAESAGLVSVSREAGRKLEVSILTIPRPLRGPEHRPLYGPIPWDWWLTASRLPGSSLQVASVCWLLAGWERSAEFKLGLGDWSEFGLSRFSATRGLDSLEESGLVAVTRQPGRSRFISMTDRIPSLRLPE